MKLIEQHLATYEQYRAVCGMKPADKTIRGFINYCYRTFGDFEKLEQWMVDRWCAKRENETSNSQYGRVAHLNTFLRFIEARKLADVTVYTDIKWRRQPKKIVYISQEEVANFFKAINESPIDSLKQKLDVMMWAILFRLVYSNGLRPLEAREMETAHVNLNEGTIKIINTKGYRHHLVAFNEGLGKLMKLYHEKVNMIYPNRKYFFVRGNGKAISKGGLWKAYARYWEKYNERPCVLYSFRHNYAIENINVLTQMGYDESWNRLMYISKSMGHSRLKETLYYYSLAPQYAKELKENSEQHLKEILPKIGNEEKEH